MSVYYNEHDPVAAATIREAIKAGAIAPGDVDERDIRDVRPDELSGYAQVHLFAGGGLWSYSLRRAGWADDRPAWSCSCPCQPFSSAGKGDGFDDERHLWPAAYWLIAQLEPECVFGEQVGDSRADPWVDLVQADLEAMDYAFGCVPLASAGFGAPNIRHRNFWVAYSARCGREGFGGRGEAGTAEYSGAGWVGDPNGSGRLKGVIATATAGHGKSAIAASAFSRLADADDAIGRTDNTGRDERIGEDAGRAQAASDAGECVAVERLANADSEGLAIGSRAADGCGALRNERPSITESSIRNGLAERSSGGAVRDPGPANGFWRDADWLLCRDPGGPRWRPVDAGTFPLAPGHPARVGGLRVSGNAINPEAATHFIEAMMSLPHTGEGRP